MPSVEEGATASIIVPPFWLNIADFYISPPPPPFPPCQAPGLQPLCENTCRLRRNGFCDDSGIGGNLNCAFGTDCDDCGPRCCEDDPFLLSHVFQAPAGASRKQACAHYTRLDPLCKNITKDYNLRACPRTCRQCGERVIAYTRPARAPENATMRRLGRRAASEQTSASARVSLGLVSGLGVGSLAVILALSCRRGLCNKA